MTKSGCAASPWTLALTVWLAASSAKDIPLGCLRFVAAAGFDDKPWTAIAELDVITGTEVRQRD